MTATVRELPPAPDVPAVWSGTPFLAPTPARRLEYIDGLRALAALWVAIHHIVETSVPAFALSLPIVGPIVGTLFFGQFPVMVFLMLSGFCLYYPCVKKNPTRPVFSTGYGAYLFRRVTRIGPPYFAAGALCLVMAAFPQLLVGKWSVTGPVDARVIVSHVLFAHNLIPSHAVKIDYPMWSIGLEWQLYLLFPVMVWAFARSNWFTVVAVSLVVTTITRAVYRHLPGPLGPIVRDGPFSYVVIFAAGMLAAALTVRGRSVAPKWLLGCVVVVGMIAVRLGSGNGLVHDLATSAAGFSVLLMAVDARSAVVRVLSSPILVKVGLFSYSLYLVHAPVVHLSWLALLRLRLSPDATCAILALAGLPLIILVSYGFHRLFERPFMRVKQAPAVLRAAPAESPSRAE